MKLGFLSDKNDFRAPLHPESIQKYNLNLFLEEGIFDNLNYTIPNEDNVTKIKNLNELDIVACVDFIEERKLKELKDGAVLIGLFDFGKIEEIKKLRPEIKVLSFFKLPRISRAQNLDALSSQANLLGYASVLRAANATANVIPMMTTAAGNIQPSKVLILGVGVAGLQAIATAKRLGARVEAFDTRDVVEEQVNSLGAKFVKIDLGETGQTDQGYAKELSPEQVQKQKDLQSDVCARSDIVITTAQLFGRPAPQLIDNKTIDKMKPGSVIFDMAVESGGNVEGSVADEVIVRNGVKIIGISNLASSVSNHASLALSNNYIHWIKDFYDKDKASINFDFNDEIIKSSVLVYENDILNERFK